MTTLGLNTKVFVVGDNSNLYEIGELCMVQQKQSCGQLFYFSIKEYMEKRQLRRWKLTKPKRSSIIASYNCPLFFISERKLAATLPYTTLSQKELIQKMKEIENSDEHVSGMCLS